MYQHGGDIYSHLNCIDFSANMNFLGMPEEVKEALLKSADACEHYPDVWMRDLRESIAKREEALPEQIICGNGAAELIFQLTAAVRPKKALLVSPGFQEYERALSCCGCQICFYELREENGFLPGEDMIDRIDPLVEMLFLCNPNNPTGQLYDPEWLLRVLKRCGETGTILVADECFLDFVPCEEQLSLRRFVPDHPNLFILKAFTKLFAMPGIRLGYGICSNRNLIRQMRRVSQPWNVSVPAQKAGCAAAGLQEYIEETRKYLKQEKDWLVRELKQLDFRVYGSAANFLFFRTPQDVEGQKELAGALLSKGFLIRDCSNYRGLGKGFYRIAVRSHADNKALVCAMREWMDEYMEQSCLRSMAGMKLPCGRSMEVR